MAVVVVGGRSSKGDHPVVGLYDSFYVTYVHLKINNNPCSKKKKLHVLPDYSV